MAQDAVINGTTYPAVEAVALTDGNGNTTQYYPDAVRYVAQSLTDAQKAQARENIGASDNPLWGKKVSFIGDSICSGADTEASYLGGYGKIIAARNGMAYENLAKAGSTITAETYSSTTGAAKSWISRMVESMSADADYAIVEGGLNDAWQYADHGTIEIGEISNGYNATLDDTTYCGAFESMLKQLVTKFQGKKVGYIAVPKMMDLYDSNRSAPNFYHIALECCAKWGVSVCDLNKIIPPFEYIKKLGTVYTVDGTHPTYEGYLKYYCDPIEAWMKTLTTGASVGGGSSVSSNDFVKKADVQIKKAQLTLEDGTTVLIDVVVASAGTTIQTYRNLMPTSIDTDGSVYNGIGWKGKTRLSASTGSVNDNTNNAAITGFIPVKKGDIVRFKFSDTSTCWDQNPNNKGWNIIAYYDSAFTWLGSACPLQSAGSRYGIVETADNVCTGSVADGGIVSFTVPNNDNIGYLRLSFSDWRNEGLSNLIVTVNEEIT